MSIFQRGDILVPWRQDLEKWAVIACDQFTSDPVYWKRVREFVGSQWSALHMILPEAELDSADSETFDKINSMMDLCLRENQMTEYGNAYIYVERTLENGMIRPGLLGLVDLEAYDYKPGSQSPVRATEKTVIERIPPRVRVRRGAKLEFPHVLMLCDDEERNLVESVAVNKDQFTKLYDFELMEGGGRIKGWLVSGKEADAFDIRFARYAEHCQQKNADLAAANVVLAVGDGNHSLAAAKQHYEDLKDDKNDRAVFGNPLAHYESDGSVHRARFALVELVNLHDPSLCFEPIHRVVTGADCEKLLKDMQEICAETGYSVTCISGGKRTGLTLDRRRGELPVAVLQEFLDHWLAVNPGKIDYIHGEAELERLSQEPDSLGFLLPAMDKGSLFRGIIAGGVLPRKTFSMGHAREKRYYLEGHRIG